MTDDGKCQLILPKVNLINKKDNEMMYFGRLADELIRYNRITAFIFEPTSYLSFSKVKYNLNEDEIIILQSLITQEYFENLNAKYNNIYVKNNTFDTSIPSKSQFYTNEIQITEKMESDEGEKEEEEKEVFARDEKLIKKDVKIKGNKKLKLAKEKSPIQEGEGQEGEGQEGEGQEGEGQEGYDQEDEGQEGDEDTDDPIICEINNKGLFGKWKHYFPSHSNELYYTCMSEICTYELILTIIKDHNKSLRNMTKLDLKNELVVIYNSYGEKIPNILNILESQGKFPLIKQVKKREINFDDLLLSEQYFLTNMDLGVIALHYKIPLVLLSSTKLIENNKEILVVYSTNDTDFYFVKVPGTRIETLPEQRLIYTPTGKNIKLIELEPDFQKKVRENINNNFMTTYIDNFNKKRRKLKLATQPQIKEGGAKCGRFRL
jgi:hypothetical protein